VKHSIHLDFIEGFTVIVVDGIVTLTYFGYITLSVCRRYEWDGRSKCKHFY
jgi:hypothetical protein